MKRTQKMRRLRKMQKRKEIQSIRKMRKMRRMRKTQKMRKIQKMQTGLKSLNVTAPQNGMLVYYSNWNGKIKPGSTINTWNPIIASIPDLTEMISKTFVNEIDISKVKEGQEVTISIDAFSDKAIKGKIISVANIGQQQSNSDAKVFEVEIKVIDKDSMLRPAMTTSNRIKINELKEVLYIPLESVFTQDNVQYVFLKKAGSITKQQIETGEASEEYIVVIRGIEVDNEISLIAPEKAKGMEVIMLD